MRRAEQAPGRSSSCGGAGGRGGISATTAFLTALVVTALSACGGPDGLGPEATPTPGAERGAASTPSNSAETQARSVVPYTVPWPPRYDPLGEYTNYVDRQSIARNSRAKLDANGVVTLRTGAGTYFYNPITIAQYGLQEWSYYRRWGDKEYLATAVRQADWLVRTQDKQTGAWYYDINWYVANMDEALLAPWAGAMVQGQAMSLLTRVASAFPNKPKYLRTARRATRPLTKSVADGGLVNYLHGRPFFEEYPTTPPSFTLNGLQHTLIGLWDLAQAGDRTAARLFDTGYKTLVYALPMFDTGTTTAYNLSHLTKPPRPLHAADRYHRIHVRLLAVLYAMRPDPTVKEYFQRWSTYPSMRSGGLTPVTSPPPPTGPSPSPSQEGIPTGHDGIVMR